MRIKVTRPQGPRLYETSRGHVPSVTEVLRITERRYLETWRARVGRQEADRVMKDAQAFGTKLHGLAEKVAWDRKFRPGEEEMRPFAEAVRQFLDVHVLEVLGTEMILTSVEQGFGGTLDLYCQLHDGSYAVVDWKTSAQLTREHGLQTAAYALLLQEQGYTVNRRLVVRVKKDAPGKFYARSYADHAGDVEAFRACVKLWRWMNKNRLLRALEVA